MKNRLSKHIEQCFFSVYILKSAISIGTLVTTIIGISLLYVLVYAFIISSVTAQIQSSFRTYFILIFFASSIMMIISSIAAIFGLLRKKNKLLVFYAITMGIYFISFLNLGIYSTYIPNQLRNQCLDNPQSSQYQIAINYANRTLCKSQCNCYFPQFQSQYTESEKIKMMQMGVTPQHISNDSLFPVNAQNCKTWSNETYPLTQQLLMIQTFFNCAGWCNVNEDYNLYYFFSNINHGIPQKSCVDAFVQFFDKFGTILQLTSFIVSGIIFLIIVIILCLCFHPQKSRQYDALKFFRQTLVHKQIKNHKKQDESEIFKFQD